MFSLTHLLAVTPLGTKGAAACGANQGLLPPAAALQPAACCCPRAVNCRPDSNNDTEGRQAALNSLCPAQPPLLQTAVVWSPRSCSLSQAHDIFSGLACPRVTLPPAPAAPVPAAGAAACPAAASLPELEPPAPTASVGPAVAAPASGWAWGVGPTPWVGRLPAPSADWSPLPPMRHPPGAANQRHQGRGHSLASPAANALAGGGCGREGSRRSWGRHRWGPCRTRGAIAAGPLPLPLRDEGCDLLLPVSWEVDNQEPLWPLGQASRLNAAGRREGVVPVGAGKGGWLAD